MQKCWSPPDCSWTSLINLATAPRAVAGAPLVTVNARDLVDLCVIERLVWDHCHCIPKRSVLCRDWLGLLFVMDPSVCTLVCTAKGLLQLHWGLCVIMCTHSLPDHPHFSLTLLICFDLLQPLHWSPLASWIAARKTVHNNCSKMSLLTGVLFLL